MTPPGDDDRPMRVGGGVQTAEVRVSTGRAWRLTEDIPREKDIQATVRHGLDVLLLPPAVWFAMPVGHIKLTKAQAARLTEIGLKRGLPDIFVLHQRLYGVELKRPGGQLSRTRIVRTRRGGLRELAGQRETFPVLEAAGLTIAVCDSLPAVLAFLTACGVPLRPYTDMAA
jgi:hypothetical protein